MPPPDRSGQSYVRGDVKQFVVTAAAGTDVAPVRASAANDRRCYYYIENTGSNLGLFAWDELIPGHPEQCINLLPGDWREWRGGDFIPLQAANFGSNAGTTFAVIEGWPPK